MSTATASLEMEQGFTVARLRNEAVSIAVLPELGAKLFSLQRAGSAREWLWRPPGPLRLFRNRLGDAFAKSTRLGGDECIPTIAPCVVNGRELPDHGEAWSESWSLDEAALRRGELRTTLSLPRSPLTLARTIRLAGAVVQLEYELTNRSNEAQPYLWALHPLLSFEPGDRLRLSPDVMTVRVEGARHPDATAGTSWAWPVPAPGVNFEELRLGGDDSYAKLFAGPLERGEAVLENPGTGDRLTFRWPAAENPFVGIWITRGGWNNFHHPAIEPTNAAVDSLQVALEKPSPELYVLPSATRRWQVSLDLTPIGG